MQDRGQLKYFPLTFSYFHSSTVKPIAPTIVSVEESNMNFQVKWRDTKKVVFSGSLSYTITYHKKGDTDEVGAMSLAMYDAEII